MSVPPYRKQPTCSSPPAHSSHQGEKNRESETGFNLTCCPCLLCCSLSRLRADNQLLWLYFLIQQSGLSPTQAQPQGVLTSETFREVLKCSGQLKKLPQITTASISMVPLNSQPFPTGCPLSILSLDPDLSLSYFIHLLLRLLPNHSWAAILVPPSDGNQSPWSTEDQSRRVNWSPKERGPQPPPGNPNPRDVRRSQKVGISGEMRDVRIQ